MTNGKCEVLWANQVLDLKCDLSSQNENVRFGQSRNVLFFGEAGSERRQHAGELVPFIERPACAPLRQSQAFSQTLVVRLAESLTLSSLR